MDQSGAELLPFYLVIDVSWSMSMDGKLASANKIVSQIVDALAVNPVLSDKVRFGLIDYSDDAHVRLPLCDLLEPDLDRPCLAVRGGTSFGAAFDTLHRVIRADVARLRADGHVVHRPTAFFLSDGEPTDDEAAWRAAFADLVALPAGLNIVPCGIDQAEATVMGTLVHPSTGPGKMALYMMDADAEPARAVTGMAEILISSMIQSVYGLTGGDPGPVLPSGTGLPAGITRHDPDEFA